MTLFRFSFYGLISLALVGCADLMGLNQENYSRIHSDSGIYGRPYAEIVRELRLLESQHPDIANVITYGQTLRGRELTMIRIRKPGNFDKRPGVLIAGSIHGNEFLNIEDRLPRWFLENQTDRGVSRFLDAGGVLWIAPILNPDGYEARTRGNNSGKDLNRDFDLKILNKKGFTQPETASLVSSLKSEVQSSTASLNITFDYHCCLGAVLYPWGYARNNNLSGEAKANHLRVGDFILKQFPSYKIGGTYELLRYTAVGNSKDFYHETFGATAYTFEGVRSREKDKFAEHTRMWSEILADQASRSDGFIQPDQSDKQPKAAILRSSATGILLAVSGSGGTSTVTICPGKVAMCPSSQSLINFPLSHVKGERIIFQAAGEIRVDSGLETFTIQAFDKNSTLIGSSTVRFSRRG